MSLKFSSCLFLYVLHVFCRSGKIAEFLNFFCNMTIYHYYQDLFSSIDTQLVWLDCGDNVWLYKFSEKKRYFSSNYLPPVGPCYDAHLQLLPSSPTIISANILWLDSECSSLILVCTALFTSSSAFLFDFWIIIQLFQSNPLLPCSGPSHHKTNNSCKSSIRIPNTHNIALQGLEVDHYHASRALIRVFRESQDLIWAGLGGFRLVITLCIT